LPTTAVAVARSRRFLSPPARRIIAPAGLREGQAELPPPSHWRREWLLWRGAHARAQRAHDLRPPTICARLASSDHRGPALRRDRPSTSCAPRDPDRATWMLALAGALLEARREPRRHARLDGVLATAMSASWRGRRGGWPRWVTGGAAL
jgi:hypothetical protein